MRYRVAGAHLGHARLSLLDLGGYVRLVLTPDGDAYAEGVATDGDLAAVVALPDG